jgi:hypothetical protein
VAVGPELVPQHTLLSLYVTPQFTTYLTGISDSSHYESSIVSGKPGRL